MSRRPLLGLLGQYRLVYPAEASVVDRITQLVSQHTDCFERTCRPGHITGSAWVLSADRRQCLLVHHRKLGRWLQPGGHADGDPDTLQVAQREACEESGLTRLEPLDRHGLPLDIDIHQIPARYDDRGGLIDDAHEHHDIRYLFAAAGEEPLAVSAESHDVRWVRAEELPSLSSEESVLRLLRKSAKYMPAGAATGGS